jgi:hypothetical protein
MTTAVFGVSTSKREKAVERRSMRMIAMPSVISNCAAESDSSVMVRSVLSESLM